MATIIERVRQDGSKSYTVQVRRRGSRPQTQTFTRRTDAKAWARSIESAIEECRATPGADARRTTLAQVINRFVEGAGRDWPKDRKAYLTRWSEALGHEFLSNITAANIGAERDRYVATGVSNATGNRYVAYLSKVLSVATKEWRLMQHNPCRDLSKLKEGKGRVRYLSADELKRLRAALAGSDLRDLPLLVEAALHSGARAGELVNLRWAELDLETGSAVLGKTKNGERRTIPLRGKVLEALRAKPKIGQYVFVSNGKPRKDREPVYGRIQYGDEWRAVLAKAEIEDFRFHDLRHHAASTLVQKGVGIYEVGHLLGHKSIEVTKRYAHLSSDSVTKLGDKLAEALA